MVAYLACLKIDLLDCTAGLVAAVAAANAAADCKSRSVARIPDSRSCCHRIDSVSCGSAAADMVLASVPDSRCRSCCQRCSFFLLN
mgnify:CR=1 FL=1